MSDQHTPGPWWHRMGIGGAQIVHDADGVEMTLAFALKRNEDDPNEPHGRRIVAANAAPEANARLIAAAPELLDACREGLDAVQTHCAGCTASGTDPDGAWTCSEPRRCENRLRRRQLAAAIAKATCGDGEKGTP